MIEKLEITSVHTEVTPELKRYITRKIGKIDKYVSWHARKSIHAEVRLKQSKRDGKKQFTCGVTLHLPHDVLDASETTVNMFAAVDIVETKLKGQLRRYKITHTSPKLRQRLMRRLRK